MRKGTTASLRRLLRERTERGLTIAALDLGAPPWSQLESVYSRENGYLCCAEQGERERCLHHGRVENLIFWLRSRGKIRAACARLGA